MNNTLKKTLLVGLASLLCAASMISCSKGDVHLKPNDKYGLYNAKTKISYSHAAPVYEATSLLKECGKLTVTDSESYVLYTIPGEKPEEMMATEDFNIVYASDLDMPTLEEMAPTVLRLCNDSMELKRMEDAAVVARVVKTYVEGTSIDYPGTAPQRSYKARFESLDYPGFYYTLTYVEYSEDLVVDDVNYGRYFLYNAFDRRFVAAGEEIRAELDQGLTTPEGGN